MNKRMKKKVKKMYMKKIMKRYQKSTLFFFTKEHKENSKWEKRKILSSLPYGTPILLSDNLNDWVNKGIPINEFKYFKKVGFIGTISNIFDSGDFYSVKILDSFNDTKFKNGKKIQHVGWCWCIGPSMVRTIY